MPAPCLFPGDAASDLLRAPISRAFDVDLKRRFAMKRLGLALVVLTITAGVVLAAPLPPGGQEINPLMSPLFLAGSPSVTSTESPQADVINPAASGGAQRTVLDLSFVGITNVAGPISYDGIAANLGLTAPTNYGVYTVSAHYLSTGSSLGLGTLGIANFSFAKDLYPGLLIGAGLSLTIGQGPAPSPGVAGNTDWGLGVNVGFLVLSGDLGILKDFRWGAAFDNIGKGFSPVNSPYAAYPAPFTPEIGVRFSLIRTKSINLGFDWTLSSPTFSDVRLDLGTTFTIEETVSLHLATASSLNNTLHPLDYPPRYFPLSGGLTVRFATQLPGNAKYLADRGWSRSEFRPTISVTPLENSDLAIGAGLNIALGQLDTTPPTITEDYSSPQWISPNNDGIKDSLGLPVRIVDNRFVYGYKFKIAAQDGTVVREIDNPDYRPESQGVQNVLDRLAAVKKGIPIPSTFVWDGRNGTGQVVPDGTYTFTITSWDENGNSATTASLPVYVKVTPPQLALQQVTGNNLIFAPGGTGLKNALEITQTGSSDVVWTGKFVDSAGATAREIEWKNSAPQSFSWDGRDSSGKIAADGVYAYRVSATDLAGNTTSGSIENIIVNTRATPVHLGINPAAFSPGTESAVQNMTFTFNVPVRTDVVSWSLTVLDAKGSAVRTIAGGSDLPATYVFNGKTDAGSVLAEGIYHGALEVLYRNGHNPQASSPAITVDLTPPAAKLTADVLVFSPNGDSLRADMIFHASASDEVVWNGTVKSSNGTIVKSYSWVGKPDATITWDGREQNGRLAPDGTYAFDVNAVDKAGNAGSSNSVSFTLDTEKKQLSLTRDFDAFSPNGARNVIHLLPDLKTTNGFVSYSFTVVDKSGSVMKSEQGSTPPPGSIAWNGTKPDGSAAPEGSYRGELTASYSNGDRPSAATGWFSLITRLPKVEANADYLLFSPNGDGQKDTVTFTQSSSPSTSIWSGRLESSDGQTVREWRWPGAPASVSWDGTDAFGNVVADGTYVYSIATTDEAGNAAKATVTGIVVDNRPTQAFVTVDSSGFSPNSDGVADTLSFSTLVTLADGIGSWELALVGSDGKTTKIFTGSGSAPPRSILWDGRNTEGQTVEGSYVGRLTVTYLKGDIDVVSTRDLVLDVTAPQVTVNLSPTPFTPDNSGVGNTLSIGISVKAPVAIEKWSFEINDPTKQPFYDFSGNGTPANTLFWNGLSATGELVQSVTDYPYVLRVQDVVGNTRIVTGVIPVGVLVMKDGDKYFIRVSNINFAPFSSALITERENPALYAQNRHVLDLIAATLKRYAGYNIGLVGNAVSVYWNDAAKSAIEQKDVLIPLSLARATTVAQALAERGVAGDRMKTSGVGAANPIVPFSDAVNLWKDRRVDFVLVRQ